MEQESQERSLITWVVGLGILLVIVVGASGYVIANPESIYVLFGGTVPTTTQPVKEVNGPVAATHTQPANTKRYSSIFFEFDYPANFVITSELVNAMRTPSGAIEERFGSAEVVLMATGTGATYTLRVTSTVNSEHTSVEAASQVAKESFFSRPDRGANDSFQDITVVDRPAYKHFTNSNINIGIPTGNLNYFVEMTWDPATGVRSTANNYIGVLEDSFTAR